MQDELKEVISQAMDTSSNFEQEPVEQFGEGELSDQALDTVAGGVWGCVKSTKYQGSICILWSAVKNAKGLG